MSGTNNRVFFLEQQFYSSYLRWQNTSVILIFCFQIIFRENLICISMDVETKVRYG